MQANKKLERLIDLIEEIDDYEAVAEILTSDEPDVIAEIKADMNADELIERFAEQPASDEELMDKIFENTGLFEPWFEALTADEIRNMLTTEQHTNLIRFDNVDEGIAALIEGFHEEDVREALNQWRRYHLTREAL
jgi:hypothetical protein